MIFEAGHAVDVLLHPKKGEVAAGNDATRIADQLKYFRVRRANVQAADGGD
jgi:hypothetical protein